MHTPVAPSISVHNEPAATGIPVFWQTSIPRLHTSIPKLHGLLGTHGPLASQRSVEPSTITVPPSIPLLATHVPD